MSSAGIRGYALASAGTRSCRNWPAELSHRGSTLVAMDPQDHAMLEALVRHGRRGQLDEFLAQGDGCAWCRHPIRLRGYVVSSDAVGRHITYTSASLPDGVVSQGLRLTQRGALSGLRPGLPGRCSPSGAGGS